MAEQAELKDDIDPILIDDEPPADDPPTDPPADLDDPPADDPPADEDEELEVTFGTEAAPASRGEDSELVRKLRAEIRDRDKRLAAAERPKPQTIERRPMPTLESCDYDEEKFAVEVKTWTSDEAKADEAEAEAQKQTQAVTARFAEKAAALNRDRIALGAKDYEAAGTAVAESLSEVQAIALIKAAKNSANVIYALGRHPQKLTELAAIDDLIEFAAEVARIEGTIKVTKRAKSPPEPDRPQRGSGQLSASSDKVLERLEAEAAKTGDRTKVVAHKRAQRTKDKS